MPLCIFDEVEAALDQANVERFAKYLSHFSDRSQFIVVTHRPGTMEQCDMLAWDITMQKDGVSKLLKVQLKDAVHAPGKRRKTRMAFFQSIKEAFVKNKDKDKYLSGLGRSRKSFGDRLRALSNSFNGVNDDLLEQIMIILLESDVGIHTAQKIVDQFESRSITYP